MSLSDDINTQLEGTQSSLYEVIEIDGSPYTIPYVNGLPEENKDLIEAGEKIDQLRANPKNYTWEEASKIYGDFGYALLSKENDIEERAARILSVKKNVERMYNIWGSS